MMENAIELRRVSYGVRTGFLMRFNPIIEKLNFSLPKGRSMGLVGPNGAGKTTTIKLCAGIIRPLSGRVFIDKMPVERLESRQHLGILTENQYAPAHLTVTEWLKMLGGLAGLSGKTLTQRLHRVFEHFELTPFGDVKMQALSKGQIQRTGFAQAMLHEPKILLLDEPMSGLDPVWRAKIQDILISYKNQGNTLLFSSHILSDVARLSDTITLFDQGKVKWQGTGKDVSEQKTKYEVIITSKQRRFPADLIGREVLDPQPDGSFRMIIDSGQKPVFFKMEMDGILSITSITPIFPGIEELLK